MLLEIRAQRQQRFKDAMRRRRAAYERCQQRFISRDAMPVVRCHRDSAL